MAKYRYWMEPNFDTTGQITSWKLFDRHKMVYGIMGDIILSGFIAHVTDAKAAKELIVGQGRKIYLDENGEIMDESQVDKDQGPKPGAVRYV